MSTIFNYFVLIIFKIYHYPSKFNNMNCLVVRLLEIINNNKFVAMTHLNANTPNVRTVVCYSKFLRVLL